MSAPAAPAHVTCPQCKAPLPCFDEQQSTHFSCPSCHMFFGLKEGNLHTPKKLRKFTQEPAHALALPVGTLGSLRGQPFRVTGYMIRKEARTRASWEEYQLLNPETHTYAQLALYEGHWTYITPTDQKFTIIARQGNRATVDTDDHYYELYNRYSPRVLYAEGEFDWNVLDDEGLKIAEFIDPPLMLVEEKKVRSATWYLAEHVEPAEVQEGFNVPPTRMPFRMGTGAVQPAPGANWDALKNFSLGLAVLVIFTHVFFSLLRPETTLADLSWATSSTTPAAAVPPDSSTAPVLEAVKVSSPFEVPYNTALEFDLRANLNNQWVEVPVVLVNEQTGRTYDFTKTMEYYSGVEDGESWSEGSVTADAVLADIPAGRYHVNLYPTTDITQIVTGNLRVAINTPLHSNVVLFLVLLLAYPAVQYLRRQNYEHSRWQNSDYGPQD
ncbi:DUF4178 domain-containing protein [Hymenobacter mucosus]|nr:DUF4178 domain-containing protein [Hymenobacter mucosus]